MSELLTRSMTAVSIGAVALFCIWYGGWPFFVLIAALAGLSMLEWAAITGTTADHHMHVDLRMAGIPVAGVLAAASVVAFAGLAWLGVVLLAGTMVAVFAISAIGRGSSTPGKSGLYGLSLVKAVGPGYIGIAALALIWMRNAPDAGAVNVALVMICVWATDIGAYFAGRRIGGPKLAPKISPAKTWSGLGGGVAASMAVAGIMHFVVGGVSFATLLGLGAVLAVIAQGGDLLESSIKRRFGVKDSGHILPGHGGILDRVDGVLTAASAMAFFIAVFGSGFLWL